MLIECDTRAEQRTIHFCPSVLEGETGGFAPALFVVALRRQTKAMKMGLPGMPEADTPTGSSSDYRWDDGACDSIRIIMRVMGMVA